ncbi:UPF0764 protein C16orf89 homolog [Hippocampus comes]|uniref:Uncharacterized protein n=1 Tax=Hippocampus comes TaxID=109280 RepID=A0A3Q2XMS8_HIPCM|nr:PREDICTED: UPF0764 protein C16orf89 homolog [Hippocampus comes]
MQTSKLRLSALATLLAAACFCSSRAEVIDDVLGSLSKGAAFLERQHQHINLDGVVGFLMLQAELKEAVRTWPHSDPVSWAQRTAAVELVKHLDSSFDNAVAALRHNDPKYYQEFEPLLSWKFWQVRRERSSTDASLVYAATTASECYDEQLSDKCLTLLLGTWKQKGTPCIVTKPCRDTMTQFGCPHYSLSHQLLYFIIGKLKGCSNLLKGDTRASRANMTERSYQKIFCSNMMKTNQDIIADGLSQQTADIFIENILICGLAGFSDFYKADWLQHILRLQDVELGCFGRDRSIISQWIGDELLEQLQPHHRVKRREKILPDGCSSHMTAVAVGALGGYLNFYLTEQDITKRPLS